MKKRLGGLILAVALASSTLTGCTIGNTEFVIDLNNVGRNDVFSINGQECSKEEAKLYLCNYQNLYGYEYGIDLWQYDYSAMDEDKTLEAYVKEVTLAQLANVMCMNQLAEEYDMVLTEDEQVILDKMVDEYYESLSKEEISYIGLDKGELKGFYESYAIAQKLYKELTQGINEEVSDDEARVILVQQIYVKDKADAKAVQKKLKKGEDFATVASNYNEAKAIEIYLARGDYAQAVDDVAFHLNEEEQSGMITTEDGYYFIKCLDKYVEDKTEENKEKIVIKRRKEQFDDVFQEFIENSEYEINTKLWDEVKVDTSGNIKTKSFFSLYEKYFGTMSTNK